MAFYARGRTVATAATAANGCAALWNPHSTQRVTVFEIGLVSSAAPAAGTTALVQRIMLRGTAGSTATPTIANDGGRAIAPVSGALLDLATYSVQPTADGSVAMYGWVLAGVAAAGIVLPFPRGIVVPPGAGLAILTGAAIAIPASDVSFVWEEA